VLNGEGYPFAERNSLLNLNDLSLLSHVTSLSCSEEILLYIGNGGRIPPKIILIIIHRGEENTRGKTTTYCTKKIFSA
jgi:hypothetical protein